MAQNAKLETPKKSSYDVVIVGGAMLGSSVAWFLSNNPDFDGSILVVEKDPTYEFTSTSHTNSCMRQQFSNEINVRISQFAAEFVKNFREFMGDDPRVPDVPLQSYGYMYLADNEDFANILRENQKLQAACGAGTKFMTVEEIKCDYPFYYLDDIIGGNHNLIDEGYFDGNTLFDWWKRSAREKGAEYLTNEVVAMTKNAAGTRVESITLKSGDAVTCGTVVNASGPRAVLTSRMAGIEIPVEPRKRYTFIFDAEQPLDRDLPLTIDPSGVHMRTDGAYYLAGCPPDDDPAVDYDDFVQDFSIWEEKVWPTIATRVPQFEAIKLINSWAGHYSFNTLDQNAIIGPHTEVGNFIFVNGFSGHGFQQSPAMGRGTAELIAYGEYRSLNLSPFSFERIVQNKPFEEKAVI
ncbi:NAD(P)/FAD-dependent oxidoreductase [Pseudohalocynthiibacter aestuariivivens]|jgi:glycine/D-amino acid oxidase-like deaminating enzyme|uniref:NAD(P)/FAD-dependent oxidoreductase n=1 Tax=Pseudohalocynthiibacter aestuariivivens TaxID=1591409 RepID=A0ABV5JFJ7_9RHOB|nr:MULTISPECIES: FAD-binding oxidoreductase [Pseudohalocynthiibacter]MBS9716447.1 FAD-binding oxidoreductase [Pseudohalocynthiibacter aestuariivivens]MCK0100744.1 FAD-binding oxidoreductase [Pseudohalocynthiibacter sp. F2068]